MYNFCAVIHIQKNNEAQCSLFANGNIVKSNFRLATNSVVRCLRDFTKRTAFDLRDSCESDSAKSHSTPDIAICTIIRHPEFFMILFHDIRKQLVSRHKIVFPQIPSPLFMGTSPKLITRFQADPEKFLKVSVAAAKSLEKGRKDAVRGTQSVVFSATLGVSYQKNLSWIVNASPQIHAKFFLNNATSTCAFQVLFQIFS